jgi:hypothetical protein
MQFAELFQSFKTFKQFKSLKNAPHMNRLKSLFYDLNLGTLNN